MPGAKLSRDHCPLFPLLQGSAGPWHHPSIIPHVFIEVRLSVTVTSLAVNRRHNRCRHGACVFLKGDDM